MVADSVVAAVAGCDLEAVEEESGALGVELIGREGAEDVGENDLDGGAVFEHGEGDGRGLGCGSSGSVGDGCGGSDGGASPTRLQVEVAEAVSADGDGGAFLSGGTDVLSLVESGFRSGRHGYPPPPPGGVGWFCLFSMVYEGIIPRYPADSARVRRF